MELVFQKFPPGALEARPGEIAILPALPEHRQRRDWASLVLELGPAALLHGAGAPERLVLNADPTLDEMLAAAFVLRQLQGQSLSPDCTLFAQYAALVREGLRPAQFPLEQSIEGIYLAIRRDAGSDLTRADRLTVQTFLERWACMAEAIFKAADAGKDPFTTAVLAAGAEFARERAFLAKDLDVYRLDFAQGEAWEVRLPGGPPRALGLLLRRPSSLLFKYWARSECPVPLGGPYLFLAVAGPPGQWIMSTDPIHKVSLKPLADLLQDAENRQMPAQPEAEPWFDGKPFAHTLVAAPRHGTRLAEKAVVRIVKKWCRATPVVRASKFRRRVALLGAALLVLLAVVWYLGFTEPPMLEVTDLHVLAIGVSAYQDDTLNLTAPAQDAEALTAAFKRQQGILFRKVFTKVMKNADATRAEILDTGLNSWLASNPDPEQALTQWSLVIVTLAGHGLTSDSRGTRQVYHFAPHDYDRDRPGSTGIYLADLQRYLSTLPCSVILILDTCHSGAANQTDEDIRTDFGKVVRKYVTDSTDLLARSKKGLFVVAACRSEQLANETRRWNYGALTLSLLEGIDGKYHYKGAFQPALPRGKHAGTLSLDDLEQYVSQRVEALTAEISNPQHRGQGVNMHSTGRLSPAQIPIAKPQ
jgi:uncharacterized caspase-like protein